MSSDNDDTSQPAKKRGRYKLYMFDQSIPIPRQTLLSRQKAASLSSQQAGQCPKEAAQGDEVLEVITPGTNRDQDPPATHAAANDAALELHLDVFDHTDVPEADVDQADQPDPSASPDPTMNNEHGDINENLNDDAVDETAVKDNKPLEKTKEYAKKHDLTNSLHNDSEMTKLDVLLMILHMAIHHCNTRHFVEDQIKFVNVLFGSNVLDVSYHVFSTLFELSTKKFLKHYVCVKDQRYLGSEDDFWKIQCPTCKNTIDDQTEDDQIECPHCGFSGLRKKFLVRIKTALCPECQKEIDVYHITTENYFVTLPLKEQIEDLLRKPHVKLVSRTENLPTTCISDVFQGEIYQNLSKPGNPLANKDALTLVINTDGVSLQKSNKKSLWPIWCLLNEIVPEQRFKRENLILAGLWYGESAPNMSLFMKPVMDAILDLSVKGVNYQKPNGEKIICPVYLLTCSVDSVAKPKVVCQKQFNAKMGCLYCFHPKDSTIGGNNKQRYYDQTVNYKIRSEDEVLRDMLEADRLEKAGELGKESVNGFLGVSILTETCKLKDIFPCNTFNMVWGVVIDYMHAVLEGVTADLFNVYENILTADQLEIVDERLKKITPPQGMTRRPRSFSLRGHWKAKEFRAVILYYALPCFEGILPNRHFELLKLYVSVLHVALGDKIFHCALGKAALSLQKFLLGYQRLYGLQSVTYNLHLLRHIIEMVIKQGPVWCYSCFIFESGNGYLGPLLRGTKSVVNELSKKHSTIQTVTRIITKLNVNPLALSFCGEVVNSKYATVSEEFSCGVFSTGSVSHDVVSDEELTLLADKNVNVDGQRVKYLNRVVRNGIIYTSKSYSRAKVYDDSCVMLKDETYAVIDKIVISEDKEVLCLIKPIRIALGADVIPSLKVCCRNAFDSSKIVLFSEVARKCLLVRVENKNYVCHIPNFYERD